MTGRQSGRRPAIRISATFMHRDENPSHGRAQFTRFVRHNAKQTFHIGPPNRCRAQCFLVGKTKVNQARGRPGVPEIRGPCGPTEAGGKPGFSGDHGFGRCKKQALIGRPNPHAKRQGTGLVGLANAPIAGRLLHKPLDPSWVDDATFDPPTNNHQRPGDLGDVGGHALRSTRTNGRQSSGDALSTPPRPPMCLRREKPDPPRNGAAGVVIGPGPAKGPVPPPGTTTFPGFGPAGFEGPTEGARRPANPGRKKWARPTPAEKLKWGTGAPSPGPGRFPLGHWIQTAWEKPIGLRAPPGIFYGIFWANPERSDAGFHGPSYGCLRFRDRLHVRGIPRGEPRGGASFIVGGGVTWVMRWGICRRRPPLIPVQTRGSGFGSGVTRTMNHVWRYG